MRKAKNDPHLVDVKAKSEWRSCRENGTMRCVEKKRNMQMPKIDGRIYVVPDLDTI